MKFLITGASGFVGRHLREFLVRAGHSVATASRSMGANTRWDPMSGPLPAPALEGVHAVVHLAGENVGKGRWTDKRMELIRESRRVGTRNVLEGIAAAPHKPSVFFCASAVGYYGDRGGDELAEQSPSGGDFLADVCRIWEQEASRAESLGMRWVSGRFGIILGAGDGALQAMLPPFQWGFGGALAGGKNWMSWIHIEDACGLILHAVERPSIQGPINITAPGPVTNREFTHTLGQILGKPALLGVPYLVLRIMVGKFAGALVSSQKCVPMKALATRYVYKFRELEPALRDCLKAIIDT